MEKELIVTIALGIGLSASTGFRVFVPLLVASIAARLGIFPVHEDFQWLGSTAAIICFATATLAEITAYYIPVVDNLLDSVASPLAFIAGSLILTSVLPLDEKMLKWIIGIIAGGGAAAVIQGGSVLTRLFSAKLTAGAGNPLVSTGENAAAFGASVLSLIFPVLMAVILILLIVFILYKLKKHVIRHSHR